MTARRLAARAGRLVVWLAVAVLAGWAVVRLTGQDAWYPAVQLLAFTPYAAAAALVMAVALWLLGNRPPALVAAASAIALAGCVLPRMLPDGDPDARATGPLLRVATANLLVGQADAERVLHTVREQRVDVLAVQEMTPQWLAAADAAGLGRLLPERVVAPASLAEGSALFARYPLTDGGSRLMALGWFQQVRATVTLPGGAAVVIESAHAASPYSAEMVPYWRATLHAEPAASAAGVPRVLMGDFNATLDHRSLRDLISTGYRDAAEVVGSGLAGTWGPYGDHLVPPVTLDHVLADRRVGVRSVEVFGLAGSDHRMVVAELVLP